MSETLFIENTELLDVILRNNLIGIYIIQDGLFRYVNQRLARLVGYTQQELINSAPLTHVINSTDISPGTSEHRMTVTAITREGNQIMLDVIAYDITMDGYPATLGMVTDVTEHCTLAKTHAEQTHFITQLVNAIPNPVFYKDELGRYMGCNTAFELFLGKKREDIIGKSVHELSPKELADIYYAADKSLFDHPGTQTYEATVQSLGNGVRNVVFNKATVTYQDGRLGGLVGIIDDITDSKISNERIRYLALYDTMTELPNRTLFMDRFKQALANAQRYSLKLAILFLDLNRFKEINDTQGHEVGDQVLIEVARRFQSTLRKKETLARLAGDEFVVITETEDKASAILIAQRIQSSLLDPIITTSLNFTVGVSIGIAFYPENGNTIEDLLKHADIAMYRAKALGGGHVVYENSMSQGLVERMQIAKNLNQAIQDGALQLHYQPKINLSTNALNGAEALLRWHDAELGWINPSQFIPIAEARNMMVKLGEWVLNEACRQLQEWKQAGLEFQGRLAVNFSSQQIDVPRIAESIHSAVSKAGLTPDCLELELTESGVMTNIERAISIMSTLKSAGFTLSIDDFGTGYSSLSYLKQLPVDTLKIDISFVSDMLENHNDLTIVTTIIGMAHNLGLNAIAEGVETHQQAQALLKLGCHSAQGYYFGHPVSAHEFAQKWLKTASSTAGLGTELPIELPSELTPELTQFNN